MCFGEIDHMKNSDRDEITVITDIEKKTDNKSSIFLEGL
jgi:hypothetical protein